MKCTCGTTMRQTHYYHGHRDNSPDEATYVCESCGQKLYWSEDPGASSWEFSVCEICGVKTDYYIDDASETILCEECYDEQYGGEEDE